MSKKKSSVRYFSSLICVHGVLLLSMSQDRVNPHYIPAAALKRFADDLGNESSTNKFLQVNRERVNTFIEKPLKEASPFSRASSNTEDHKTTVAGIHSYDFDSATSPKFIQLQNQPVFQPSLGARSRFGDGDGSFFDRWLSSDAMTSAHVRDKNGLPVMK
ncbi:hypothetical protein EON64_04220 [archaeon]|nr:MAG: hypothetical protein EON64_04220 [archaeon]